MIDNISPQGQTPEQANFRPVVQQSSKPTKRERMHSAASTIAVLLIAPLVAIFLTAFVFQSYQVDGQSMETTLSHNDRLLVWKVPKSWSRITGNPYIPQRGDVVVFVDKELGSFGQDTSKQLVKRVIALPGERVTVEDGKVYVYNKENPQGFVPDDTLPYGEAIQETIGEKDVTVPEGSLYVLGDNRANSLDSRSFGPIDANDIVGKLVMRVWPLGNTKTF